MPDQSLTQKSGVVIFYLLALVFILINVVYVMVKLWPTEVSDSSSGQTNQELVTSVTVDTIHVANDSLTVKLESTSGKADESQYKDSAEGNEESIHIFWGDFTPAPEEEILLLVILGGMLGGSVRGIRDLVIWVGNNDMPPSWTLWTIMQPALGGGVGLIFYLIIRGGFFSLPVESSGTFSFVGLAVMTGLFNDEAWAKLKKVGAAIFSRKDKKEDKPDQPA